MEKVFSTIYGDIKLVTRYDTSYGEYYDAYNESDIHLGELWDMPYYDEDDPDSEQDYIYKIQEAIDDGDLIHPLDAGIEPINTTKQVYIINVLESNNGVCTAVATPYYTKEQCKQHKNKVVTEFIDSLNGAAIRFDDSDTICEVKTQDESRYLCVTYKLADIK